eukprot:7975232-Pyramimonas_sp.AAC.1
MDHAAAECSGKKPQRVGEGREGHRALLRRESRRGEGKLRRGHQVSQPAPFAPNVPVAASARPVPSPPAR